MSALRFKDRVAIVTGGCTGIGKGVVDVLVEHGGKVAVFDIDDKAGKAMTDDQIFYVKCDVTNDQDVEGGIAAMTRSIAIDEGKTSGVRINCISPGVIQTPMLDKVLEKNPHMEEPLKNTTQMGRYGQPREVGLTCLYLAVDATYSTGSDVLMTGGFDLGLGQKM